MTIHGLGLPQRSDDPLSFAEEPIWLGMLRPLGVVCFSHEKERLDCSNAAGAELMPDDWHEAQLSPVIASQVRLFPSEYQPTEGFGNMEIRALGWRPCQRCLLGFLFDAVKVHPPPVAGPWRQIGSRNGVS